MLRSLKDLEQYTMSATDGDVGTVVNFLLDDERWVVRYLVVDAGGFLQNRRVIISPMSFRQADWSTRRFHVALTTEKIKKSPSIDLDAPVSRQHEQDYYRYYGYPYYWGGTGLWGIGANPNLLGSGMRNESLAYQPNKSADMHLRSEKDVRGYHIQGTDGTIGHIEDFVVDDETWEVRYLVIDTSNWWIGKKVLVAPQWASNVSWYERKVYLDITRQAIKESPEWDATAPINREYEAHLYDYYGRPIYWGGGDRPQQAQQLPHQP